MEPHDAAKAVSHPLRAEILRRFDGREASPVELATEMGESVGHVAYHARQLADMGTLRLIKTIQRRGALEHIYTATVRIKVVQELLDDPARSNDQGGFD